MASLVLRGKNYYLQYYVAKKLKRVNLHTQSLQVAREKQRQFESARYRGDDSPLPTRTPIFLFLNDFRAHLNATKAPKNAQKVLSYLRQIFGPVCPDLSLKNVKISAKARKCPSRRPERHIELTHIEELTTRDVAEYIAAKVRDTGITAKTANRYREILTRLINWGMKEGGVRMPGGKNPAAAVERYRERPPEIVFLSREQIAEQLRALEGEGVLRAAVATYIFAGLRREELLWLRLGDVDYTTGKYGVIRVCAKTIGDDQWMPKTGKNRVVPVSSALRAILDQYRPQPTEHGWFFPSPQGKRWDPDNFSRSLEAANRRAGLSWGCAEYRHTFGSHLAMRGESLYKISAIMGNSPEICRRHYAALMPESLVGSVEFDSLTAPPPGPPPAAGDPENGGPASCGERPRLRLVVNRS